LLHARFTIAATSGVGFPKASKDAVGSIGGLVRSGRMNCAAIRSRTIIIAMRRNILCGISLTSKVLKYGDDNRFDILASFQNKTMTFEVKEDFTHAKTGNVGLEFSCRGKLSGISVSKAEYYIYKIHNADGTCGIYLFRTEVLKKMANDKLYFRIVNGGDVGSNSMNYLFKDYVFYKYAKKIG